MYRDFPLKVTTHMYLHVFTLSATPLCYCLTGDGGVTSGQSAEQQQQSDDVSLRDMFTSEALRPLSHDPEFQQAVEPHLPPTNEDTETAVTTPQFQQVGVNQCTSLISNCTSF